ncbi:MAG: hypothetical protein ABIK44_00465 [candidate division WOR-3 bacterium]
MKRKPCLFWYPAAFTVLLVLACDELLPPDGGLEPTGTPFTLHPGIAVIAIAGSVRNFSPNGQFALDMTIRSKTSSSVSDTLPAGLLLVSTKRQVQHMVLLKPHIITAGSSATLVVLGTFCCNEFREIPNANDSFALGPITDNAGLNQIIAIIRHKNISNDLGMVQRAVWMVTDSTGLTQAYIDSLNALPADTLMIPGRRKSE